MGFLWLVPQLRSVHVNLLFLWNGDVEGVLETLLLHKQGREGKERERMTPVDPPLLTPS